ncbi:MAG: trehalose-phosphatase [Actinomycetota bacterium]
MDEDPLGPFLASPATAGLFLDFDGTLAEIVPLPSDARPLPGVGSLLKRLGKKFAVVAIVSGRSARQLLDWLGGGVEIWGVHGAERVVGDEVVLVGRAEAYSELMAQVRAEAEAELAELGVPGTFIEDKTTVFNLHFRTAPNVAEAWHLLGALADKLAARHGLTPVEGRHSFELRPPADFSKAAVVLERTREAGLESVAFVGDDRVDLPAFDALDALAEEDRNTLRVAVRSDEAPPELLARADIVVDGPRGVVEFLERLV